MNYAKIKFYDVANGPGIRVSLFVSGCDIHCPGCFNKEAWNFDYGEEYTADTFSLIYNALQSDYIRGFTVLGGEPLHPKNLPYVRGLCHAIRSHFPDKSIWVYTGYELDDVREIIREMSWVDVFCVGPFVQEKADPSLKFRGSSNQRFYSWNENLGIVEITKVIEERPYDYEVAQYRCFPEYLKDGEEK